MKYLIVIEKTRTGYSAYAPDVDGCIATGKTRRQTEKLMREALEFHFEAMAEDGEPAPKPTSGSAYVVVTQPKVNPNPEPRRIGLPVSMRGTAARYGRRRNGEAAHPRRRP